jgi:hypothetical protein
MASSNTNIESKSGFAMIKAAQSVYEESATAKAILGTRLVMGERVFHYAYAGGVALGAGKLVTPAGWNAGTLEVNKAVAAAAAVGTKSVTVTTAAAWTALDEGFMVVNDQAGEGQVYKIRSSEANASTATSTDITLYDPIETALTTSSQVELYTSPYYDLDLADDVTDHIVGVPPIAVTANYYFWLQTWGPAAVLVGATTAAGDMLAPHTTDGSVYPAAAYTSNIIGYALTAGTASEYNGAWLRIAP